MNAKFIIRDLIKLKICKQTRKNLASKVEKKITNKSFRTVKLKI